MKSDLYNNANPSNTIHGLGFKNEKIAWKSIQKIENSNKTKLHKMQAAIAMMLRARYHPHKTKNIKKAEKLYKKYIDILKERFIKC
jgi:hypothetical protein